MMIMDKDGNRSTRRPTVYLVVRCTGLLFAWLVLTLLTANPTIADPGHPGMLDAKLVGISAAVRIDDRSLSNVRGKGTRAPNLTPTDSVGVILWDESGQGSRTGRHTQVRAAGNGNVQRSTVVIRRY